MTEPTSPVTFSDAWSPRDIAQRVRSLGVAKAQLGSMTLFALAALAGAFISLGGLFYMVVVTGSELGLGPTRLLGGVSFSLGLILVIVGGAELFTGNNLIAMAWASGLIGTRAVLRNWCISYLGNVAGCLGTVVLVVASGVDELGGGAVRQNAVLIASAKCSLSIVEALARGMLCNGLVCLAVWLAMGGRSVSDKILAIIFPVAAFVAMGFEHSIANWFFIPLGYAIADPGVVAPLAGVQNLLIVTLGNVMGGTLLVASVYWIAYLREPRQA